MRTPLFLLLVAAVGCGTSSSKGPTAPSTEREQPAPVDLVLLTPEKGAADVSVLQPESGELLTRIRVGEGPHEVASAPDYRRVVVSNYGKKKPGNSISVIDVPAQAVTKTIATHDYERPHDLVFLPEGRLVAVTVEEPGALLVIDIDTGEIEKAIATEQRKSHMLALNPDATRAFVANVASGSVSVIDLVTDTLVAIVKTDAGAEGITYVPSTEEVWVTNRDADNVSVIDGKSLTVIATIPTPTFPIRARYVASQNVVLVAAALTDTIYVLDVERREVVRKIQMPGLPTQRVSTTERLFGDKFSKGVVPIGILLTPDETHAYVANSYADVISVLNLSTWEVERLIPTRAEPDGLAWGRP